MMFLINLDSSVVTNTSNSLLFDGSTYHVYDINVTEWLVNKKFYCLY